MTPTFFGRIQTRLFLLATVGVVWTLIVAPFLPHADAAGESATGELYSVGFQALFWTGLIGCVVWEPIYHLLQQFRWEKDWPIIFGLLTGIPEGIVVFMVLNDRMMEASGTVTTSTFVVHFTTTWILVWLAANGPMRVIFLRWRFRGGRLLVTETDRGRLDVSFLDSGAEARRLRIEQRSRRGLAVSAAVTAVWLVAVTATGAWGRVLDNWAAAVTMVFGSFVAGSTPQGGGAVAFPVFTKILEVPAEVARSFSLCIQTVGMGAASLSILLNRRRVEWRALALGAPVAVAGFLGTLLLAGDPDAPFWPSRVPGAYVKVTFTLVLASMAFVVYLGWRTPVRRIGRALPPLNHRLRAALVVAGLLGGVASALVGSGADVMIYLFIVRALRARRPHRHPRPASC